MAWVLDLDGVVWLGDEVIAGSPGAVDRLRAAGERLLFITNNSSLTVVAGPWPGNRTVRAGSVKTRRRTESRWAG